MRSFIHKFCFTLVTLLIASPCFCWGFFAHRMINHLAIFLLPPEMMVLYKPNIEFITEHAIDPDRRRYAVPGEAPRHYIDINNYGDYPFTELPRDWDSAVAKYGMDTILENGIVPWHVQVMLYRLTNDFRKNNFSGILRNSAAIGHYIADAHVPLHASNNHNGQLTNQKGIHGFWESRIPELLAEKQFDFFIGKAQYIEHPAQFIWARVLESAREADTVLRVEKDLSEKFPGDSKYAFEERNDLTTRQYSSAYAIEYNKLLKGMVERRMRQSIFAIASFWFTAWVNAGQPDLKGLAKKQFSEAELKEFEKLNTIWKKSKPGGRAHDE